MTARQPRRTRRRTLPPSALPRPSAPLAATAAGESAHGQRRTPARHREHHVTRDYRYVHTDLLTIAAVGVVVIAFIVAMSFLL